MNVAWVVEHNYALDPAVDAESLKSVGPIWGSWTTWRSCSTDNVVCHQRSKAQELVARNFQNRANFYTHKDFYADLGRPTGLHLYDGEYQQAVDSIDDIISLHLAAATAEIVLLLGFNFGKIAEVEDRYEQHKLTNRFGLIRSVITQNTQIQWVAIDHQTEFDLKFQNIPNLTCDTMSNVLKLLAQ